MTYSICQAPPIPTPIPPRPDTAAIAATKRAIIPARGRADRVPEGCLQEAMLFLNLREFTACLRVCKIWRNAALNASVVCSIENSNRPKERLISQLSINYGHYNEEENAQTRYITGLTPNTTYEEVCIAVQLEMQYLESLMENILITIPAHLRPRSVKDITSRSFNDLTPTLGYLESFDNLQKAWTRRMNIRVIFNRVMEPFDTAIASILRNVPAPTSENAS